MTWAEFQIRSFGWMRKDKRESWKLRQVAYASLISMGVDPKKVKINNFWRIDDNLKNNKKAKERRQKRIMKAIIQYQIDLQKSKNGG